VVRHEDIAEDLKGVFLANFFEVILERVSGRGRSEDVGVAVATDGYEVEVSGSVMSDETFGHSGSCLAPLDNPPFSIGPKRMGHPMWCFVLLL
jgi:hypothetical protein